MENILVRSVNWLGDAVMTTPAWQRLREGRPQARLTVLGPEKLAGLWEGQPFVDEALTFPPGASLWQTARRLRERKFSAAIAFPNSLRAALELWLAGIPRRTGRARAGRNIFLTNAVPPRPGTVAMRRRSAGEIRRLVAAGGSSAAVPASAHQIYDYLHLVSALGASAEPLAPRIVMGEPEREAIAARLGLPAGRREQPLCGLNPGAEYGPAKRWPVKNFVAAAAALQGATGCRWVILGGPGDREIARAVAAGLGARQPAVINLAGRTTLRELAGALKSCSLVLTNDSGAMHLAAAVGTAVIVPFGSTSPEMTGPLFSGGAQILRAAGVPCAPCFRRECPIDVRCLTRIEPAAAVEAGLRALAAKFKD